MDDNAPGWTESIHDFVVGPGRVPVSAGTVPRAHSLLRERFARRVFERLRPELCAHTLMLLRRFQVAWIPNANGVGPFCVCGLHARFRVRALPRGLAEWVGVRIVLRLNIPIAYL